jgi:hypothetical protein
MGGEEGKNARKCAVGNYSIVGNFNMVFDRMFNLGGFPVP